MLIVEGLLCVQAAVLAVLLVHKQKADHTYTRRQHIRAHAHTIDDRVRPRRSRGSTSRMPTTSSRLSWARRRSSGLSSTWRPTL